LTQNSFQKNSQKIRGVALGMAQAEAGWGGLAPGSGSALPVAENGSQLASAGGRRGDAGGLQLLRMVLS